MSETTTETTEAVAESTGDNSEADATEATTKTAESEVRDPAKLLSAYEAEKGKRKEQDAALRELRSELDAIKAKAEGKEKEFAAQQEEQRIKDEALAAANDRILKAELRAAAKGKLSDPSDAFRYPEQIDLTSFEVGEDGSVDAAALEAAVDKLVESKPYLAAQGKRFQGTADGGARNGAAQPSQLSKADLAGMSADQINEARAAGQLNDLLGIKQ